MFYAINVKAEPVCCKKAYTFEAQYIIMHRLSHLPHLSLLLDFVFMTAKAVGLPENAFSKCVLCATWQSLPRIRSAGINSGRILHFFGPASGADVKLF